MGTARLEEADRSERTAEIGAAGVAAACRVCNGGAMISTVFRVIVGGCFEEEQDVRGPRLKLPSTASLHLITESSPKIASWTGWLWLILLVLILLIPVGIRTLLRRPAAVLTLIHRGGRGVAVCGYIRPEPVS